MRSKLFRKCTAFSLILGSFAFLELPAASAFSCMALPFQAAGTTVTGGLNGSKCEYTYTAGDNATITSSPFVIPAYVTQVSVRVTGSAGGSTQMLSAQSGYPAPYTGVIAGGRAAQIEATIAVKPGQVLSVYGSKRRYLGVNCKIGLQGTAYPAARGGGYARVLSGTTDIIAGGGGGAGCSTSTAGGAGGDASLINSPGSGGGNAASGPAVAGAAATSTTPGAGGAGNSDGLAGTTWNGGIPGRVDMHGGHGGDGAFGGGGGGGGNYTNPAAGGGGGSSSLKGATLVAERWVTNTLATVFISYNLPALPGAPGTPDVSLNFDPALAFSVAFSAPTNTGSSAITSYTAQLFIDGNATAIKVSGTSSPISVAYPKAPVTTGSYTFKVVATNSVGTGPSSSASNAIIVTSTPPSPPPAPPIAPAIGAISSTSNSATIAFTPLTVSPSTTSNLAITNYTVTAFINGVATNLSASGSSNPLTVSGLTSGITYKFNVTATTTAGTSPLNLSGNVTPAYASIPSDSILETPTVTMGSSLGQANLAFETVTAPAGTTITAYRFTATPTTGNPITFTADTPVASPFLFSGLSSAQGPYTFTYAAVNEAGVGPSSPSSAPYIVPTLPGVPTLESVTVNPIAIVGKEVRFSRAAIPAGGLANTKYTITFHPRYEPITVVGITDFSLDVPTSACTGASCVYTMTSTDLTNMAAFKTRDSTNENDMYPFETVTVTASNVLGTSEASNSLRLIPGRPGGVPYSFPGFQQIQVFPYIEQNAATPTSIKISAYTTGSVPIQIEPNVSESTLNGYVSSCTVVLPAQSCTISGLTNGVRYFLHTRNFNESGGSWIGNNGSSGNNDGSNTAVTPVNIAEKSPINVVATKKSNTSANVVWDFEPALGLTAGDMRAHIDSYTVTAYKTDGTVLAIRSETVTAGSQLGTPGTPYEFTGLTLGQAYTFTVKAHVPTFTLTTPVVTINGGTTASSSPSNLLLLADVPSTPAAPTITYYGYSAEIAYVAPAANGSDINGYTFSATPVGGGAVISRSTSSTISPYSFSGLNPTTSYIFTMSASNSIGSSETSSATSHVKADLYVTPTAINILEGSPSPSYAVNFTVASIDVDAAMNNSGWVAPTCGVSPAYTSATAPGNYPITCTGANGGTLFNIFYVQETLTVTAKLTVYVVPDANMVTQGTGSVLFTNKFETTPFDSSTAFNPAENNVGWEAPQCNINPTYAATTPVGSYPITCSGGNGGALYKLDYSYTDQLTVTQSFMIPEAPENFTVVATSNTTTSTTYTAPLIGTPITGYVLTATPIGCGATVNIVLSSSDTSGVLAGLSPGVKYNFSLRAQNANGLSSTRSAALTMGGTDAGCPTNNNSGGGSSSPRVITPAPPVLIEIVDIVIETPTATLPITVPVIIETVTAPSEISESPALVLKSSSIKVYFANGSSALSSKARSDLRAYVRKILKQQGSLRVVVIGIVEPTKRNPIPVPVLAKARATSVANQLKALGLKGKYQIKGGGLAGFKGDKARYANVTVSWR